jgi:uncharacterized protein (TIGR00369 family)
METGLTFQPRDPDYERRTRDSYSRQEFMRSLGARMTALSPGECELTVDYREDLSQQHGYFHGGVVGTLADVGGGYAAYSLLPQGQANLTVEYKLNLVSPGLGRELRARARAVRSGRTLTVCHCDVFAVDENGNETLCATALATYMAISTE